MDKPKYVQLPKSHKKCGEYCCHEMECCPRGIVEKWQNFRYMRAWEPDFRPTVFEYWWHAFKSLIGLNRYKTFTKECGCVAETDDLDWVIEYCEEHKDSEW